MEGFWHGASIGDLCLFRALYLADTSWRNDYPTCFRHFIISSRHNIPIKHMQLGRTLKDPSCLVLGFHLLGLKCEIVVKYFDLQQKFEMSL